ncbi:hypothetical protein EGR_10899 [Echinococcus granulosus]|uniref:Uncharacterized protein n=1 Tax=Echinococcus granulosus TaxID=6210 RepID=W6UL59_ECHGR|nr:hypothetical protein EGR_10899 [Echinococcus granulosus]EUB54244.1 hypothetical protein EGR_10899 [Echinococcus granulosus]
METTHLPLAMMTTTFKKCHNGASLIICDFFCQLHKLLNIDKGADQSLLVLASGALESKYLNISWVFSCRKACCGRFKTRTLELKRIRKLKKRYKTFSGKLTFPVHTFFPLKIILFLLRPLKHKDSISSTLKSVFLSSTYLSNYKFFPMKHYFFLCGEHVLRISNTGYYGLLPFYTPCISHNMLTNCKNNMHETMARNEADSLSALICRVIYPNHLKLTPPKLLCNPLFPLTLNAFDAGCGELPVGCKMNALRDTSTLITWF